ncbi:UNVERIFIED_CONTAM: hypothetical protein Sangu_1311400 [Sesamum angustifolium]|uniref:Uncharacterized protein n=1 Tax=Sesamum angustifolium TaxID=2727405 RepID=A0AAW2NL86_9LAMI
MRPYSAARTIMEIDYKALAGDPMIHFSLADVEDVHLPHNDALIIFVTLANYTIQLIFVDIFGNSTDALFHNVYLQMELGDVQLELVDTLLYDFVGEVVHPLGQILFALSLNT